MSQQRELQNWSSNRPVSLISVVGTFLQQILRICYLTFALGVCKVSHASLSYMKVLGMQALYSFGPCNEFESVSCPFCFLKIEAAFSDAKADCLVQ